MAASVRIEDEAFADVRIELLGSLAGYNRYEALGRMAHLWRLCTQRQQHIVSEALIVATLGPAGVDSIIGAELGERVDGGIRVRGTGGRIEWLGALSSTRQRAGQVRAAGAVRDERGRLVARSTSTHQQTTSTSSASGSGDASQGAHRHATSTPPAHAGDAGPAHPADRQQTASKPPAKSSAPAPAPAPAQIPESALPRARSVGTGVPVPDAVAARRDAADAGWARFADLRRRVAAGLGEPPPRDLHPLDPGRAEIQARLAEAGPERAEADLDHVLAVLEAEASAQGTLRWLDGGAFRAERWSRAIATTRGDAARPRAKAKPPERDVRVGRIEPHPPSAYPDGEVAL